MSGFLRQPAEDAARKNDFSGGISDKPWMNNGQTPAAPGGMGSIDPTKSGTASKKKNDPIVVFRYGKTDKAKDDKVMTASAALIRPWAWDEEWKQKQLSLVSRIIGKPLTDFTEEFFQVWKTAVTWAAEANAAGKTITPYEALDRMARENNAHVTLDKDGNVLTKTTAKSVDNITEGQAWGYLQGAVQEAIGRAPTTAELRRFLSKARDVAADNPTITRTTTRTRPDGTSQTSSQETTGGMKEGDLAMEAANMAATPEAAAYQVAGKYMEALMGLLDGPVDLETNF